jgi:cyclopropane fatty-acyl-phospholipid synthase-like methyltransferase
MEDIWNDRYNTDEYYFGTHPNEFFRTFIDSLPVGKILLPGAGEGRNAVYAADTGWEVDAFDFSSTAREKALRLAKEKGADIHYSLQRAPAIDCKKDYYDVVAILFLHLPPAERKEFHRKIVQCLKPQGGNLYILAFAEEQQVAKGEGPAENTGFYSKKELLQDFQGLHIDLLQEEEVELQEGRGYQGKARVVKLMAIRRQHEDESDTLTL